MKQRFDRIRINKKVQKAVVHLDHVASQEKASGVVVQVDRHGLALLKTKADGRVYPFTFDKIRLYRGESAGELGLRLGTQVQFSSLNGMVKDVEIVGMKRADVRVKRSRTGLRLP